MDPSARGPFIRGVIVAALLAVVIIGSSGFKRAGVKFDYEVASTTKCDDGEVIEAHWSGNGSESRSSRHYDTSDEDAPPLHLAAGKSLRHSQRHFDVTRHGRDDDIEGYSVRRYTISETDTLWFKDADTPATAHIVTEYWMAPDLDGVAGPVLTFADSVIQSRVGIDEPRRAGRHSARAHHLPGTPLRIVSHAVYQGPDGRRCESETTSELSGIERAPRFGFRVD